MHFGQPFISPPLLYYFNYTPYPYVTAPLCYFSNASPETEAPQSPQPEQPDINKIVVTRDDLIEEGYEQTKKAWT